MYENNNKISKLTFITTQSCNLNCKYCYIQNTNLDKEYYQNRHQLLTESLKNNTYIDNYIKGLKRIGQDPKNIMQYDFWGQEPTLNMECFYNNFNYFYKNFPNVKETVMSTNAINNLDKIIDAMNIVDDTVENDFLFNVQLSIDGREFNKLNRGIDIDIILENITNFILKLNKIKFQKIKVHLNLHNVLSKNVFNTLKTQDEINNYWNELNGYAQNFKELSTNKNVRFTKICPPAIEFPILDCSKEEGENLYNFLYKSLQGSGQENFFAIFEKIRARYEHFYLKRNMSVKDVFNNLKNLNYLSHFDRNFYENLSHGVGCGVQSNAIKMEFDGTLCFCQNAMFQHRPEDFKNINTWSDLYFQSMMKKGHYPNLLSSPIEEINKYFDFYLATYYSSFGIKFINILNIMNWLAECKLINPLYKTNKEKAMRHALLASWLQTCPHADIAETGSPFGKSIDFVKLYANGVLDLVESYIFNNTMIEVNNCE